MIKPINEIPMNKADRRKSYRQMIRDDIQYAIDQGIEKFEFDGDYSWKYLAQYAREEADIIWRKTWRDIMRKAKKEHGLDGIRMTNPCYQDKGQYIKISSVKFPDRIHVYCQIDRDAPMRICGELIKEAIAEKEKKDKAVIRAKSGDLSVDIGDIGLSYRAYICLKRGGLNKLGDLIGKTENDLMRIRNLGKKSVTEIIDKMKEYGMEGFKDAEVKE